jgi:hypothetical protein
VNAEKKGNGPNGFFQQQNFGAPRRNNYQIATPLASLQQDPAPVDCPICGVREMTRTEFVNGGTTQYVALHLHNLSGVGKLWVMIRKLEC